MMADCGHGPLGMSEVSEGGDGATAGKSQLGNSWDLFSVT